MSLRLTKPGLRSGLMLHPKTGEEIKPIGILPSGKVVWPVMGASSDDVDDPAFTGEDDSDDDAEEDDDDEDEDEDEEEKPKPRKSTKTKNKVEDDEDDEDEEEKESRIARASRQAKQYRLRLRKLEEEFTAYKKNIEDDQKAPDEVAARDLADLRAKNETLAEANRVQTSMLAFFKTPVPGVEWVDASDVFALAEREGLFDEVVDEDGNVDQRELRRGLKDLAKRKPHLVKKDDSPKARGRKVVDSDDDDDEDDDEPRSKRSAASMNGSRKGSKTTGPDRKALAKKFPVLNRL